MSSALVILISLAAVLCFAMFGYNLQNFVYEVKRLVKKPGPLKRKAFWSAAFTCYWLLAGFGIAAKIVDSSSSEYLLILIVCAALGTILGANTAKSQEFCVDIAEVLLRKHVGAAPFVLRTYSGRISVTEVYFMCGQKRYLVIVNSYTRFIEIFLQDSTGRLTSLVWSWYTEDGKLTGQY